MNNDQENYGNQLLRKCKNGLKFKFHNEREDKFWIYNFTGNLYTNTVPVGVLDGRERHATLSALGLGRCLLSGTAQQLVFSKSAFALLI
jgi:hypothetical protein